MGTGGLEIADLTMIQDHGIRRRKDLDHHKDMETVYMQEERARHLVRESTCKAGPSGSARTPDRLTCFAGAGSGAGSGTSSPAIKRPSGVNSPKGKRGSPLYI